MKNVKKIGELGENYAKKFLINNGHEIISTNYRCRTGEIDIIAKEQNYIVFVEVKYRRNLRYGYPRESVNLKKQNKIKSTAIFYIASENIVNTGFRFDVIEIMQVSKSEIKIEHIKNAF